MVYPQPPQKASPNRRANPVRGRRGLPSFQTTTDTAFHLQSASPGEGDAAYSSAELLRVFWPFFRPYHWRIAGAALALLMCDRTSIVIAHRLATVVRADRILLMDGGRITATGTHEQLINESALYRHLADLQFSTPQSGTQGAPLN